MRNIIIALAFSIGCAAPGGESGATEESLLARTTLSGETRLTEGSTLKTPEGTTPVENGGITGEKAEETKKSCHCLGGYSYFWECSGPPSLPMDEFCGPAKQMMCSSHYDAKTNRGMCSGQISPLNSVSPGVACATEADCDKPCHQLFYDLNEVTECGAAFIDAGCGFSSELDSVRWLCS